MSKRPHDNTSGDESKQESSKKVKLESHADEEKPQCPICDEEWEADESPSTAVASRVPRMLPCGHSLCTKCMAGILKQAGKRSPWTVNCPECRDDEAAVVTIKGVKPDPSLSALEVAKRMPPNYALTRATRVQSASKGVRCVIRGCSNPVTHFCFTKCKEQCAKHERDCHAGASGFAAHERVPIADKEAHIAAQESKDLEEVFAVAAKAADVEATRELLAPHTTVIRQGQAKLAASELQLVKQRKDVDAEVAAQRASIADLKAMIPALESNLTNYEQLSRASEANVKAAQDACRVKSVTLQAEVDVLSALTVEQTLAQKDKFAQLDSKPLADASTQLQRSLQGGAALSQSHPLIQLVRQIQAPALLPSLAAPQRANVMRFLGDTPLAGAQLLFKASRDGQYAKDLISKCAGKSNTLTLVKVAGTGYLFGAYFACAWPAVGADKTIADPSGRSFLFSLVNKDNQPVRFTLADKDRALQLYSDAIYFGGCKTEDSKQVSWANFALMCDGRPANDGQGNVANDTAVCDCAFQPEGGSRSVCDHTFIAGSQRFGADEIEVYQLAPAPLSPFFFECGISVTFHKR